MSSNKINKIPISRISELSHNGIVFRHISKDEQVVTIDHVHQDNYYVFIFLDEGKYKACIDFDEYQLNGTSIAFISPGQVHFNIGYENVTGWFLAVDALLINDAFREVFEKVSIMENVIVPNKETVQDLKSCLSILYKKIQNQKCILEQNLVYALISSYIGLIAGIYRNNISNSLNKRPVIITHQFKKVLFDSYKTVKSPSQYASKLNLSLSYLNEVVKETTGFSVSRWIQNEIILQAKRLLFYTNLSIKKIALELGYDDYAYFTRLFTRITGISPTQFRANYRK
jgi:AraC-like DNA-binding protein